MSSDGRTARRPPVVLVAAALTLAAGAGGACSSAGGDGGSGGGTAPASEPASSGRDERAAEPPGTDTEAVTGDVEELLRRYDEAVNAIIADPSVVRDRAAPVVAAYLDLFEPGSAVADEALAGWADAADAGTTVRPLDADTPMTVSRLDGAIEAVGDDEVGFATCSEHHYQLYDGEGTVHDVVDMVGRSGQGVAVRVDGRWHLRRLELRDDRPACATGTDDTAAGTTGAAGGDDR